MDLKTFPITVPIMTFKLDNYFTPIVDEELSEAETIDDLFTVQHSITALKDIVKDLRNKRFSSPEWQDLTEMAQEISLDQGLSELICVSHLKERWKQVGVVPYHHQISTLKRVVQHMRGRAILADEVGLGKTIEAGMIIKEYQLRGLARRVLILVPASLSWQWQTELKEKFAINASLQRSEYDWERCEIIVASIDTAKRDPHRDIVMGINWDMVIVDEAHKLKNSNTKNWQFVNELSKKYCLLLTATPIQNDLKEIYNLITLLKPGQLGTFRSFKKRFVVDKRTPKNQAELQGLLSQVMIRNRRGPDTVEFTKRNAHRIPVRLSTEEKDLYDRIVDFVRRQAKLSLAEKNILLPLITLQREACSSSFAAALTLNKLAQSHGDEDARHELVDLINLAAENQKNSKLDMVLKLLEKMKGEKAIVFTEYRATQQFVRHFLEQAGYATVGFDGSMSSSKKSWVRFMFEKYGDVLVSTESGGEGLNFQFCHNVINFDLPWNPMRLEQRIGRVHRLGQKHDVHIFNFATQGTIEEHILHLLDEKINMFEMVIGELDTILSRVNMDQTFESSIIDIILKSESTQELAQRLDELGDQIVKAKQDAKESLNIDELLA